MGSGTSLPSVVARKFTNLNRVIATDNLIDNPKLSDLIKFTLDANETLDIQLLDLNWSNFDLDLIKSLPRIDFLIGSDVFFDSKCTFIVFCFFLRRHTAWD